jgi:hypothetical protein
VQSHHVGLDPTVLDHGVPRCAVLTVLVVAACGSDRAPADRASGESAADPWANPRPASEAPARRAPPVRPLSMEGEIQGATPELLATPLPGYDDPKLGDWRAYRYITLGNLGSFHSTAIAIVTAVTPTTVTIELSGRLDETGEQRTDGADEFPRRFTVAHEIHRHHNWDASHVHLSDGEHSIAGRTFRCKKLEVSFDDPLMPGKDTTVEACLSAEVPAGGEVFVREVQKTPTFTITSTGDLIGFGNAHDTIWGKRPTGL